MGTSKALLEWHGSPLVVRVARLLGRVAATVVVVSAPGRRLPQIPGALTTADAAPDHGPLEGIAAGLRALEGRCDVAFVAGTDHPLLHPAFVLEVVDAIAGADAAVPRADGMPHPLTAAYGAHLLQRVDQLLAGGERRATALVEAVDARLLDAARLVHRESLWNVNTPQEYEQLLGLDEPAVRVGETVFAASTVGRLLDQLPGGLPEGAALMLDGERVDEDVDLPLAEGDELTVT